LTIQLHSGHVEITPAEAGYSEQALERLDEHLAALIKNGRLQCASYLFARNGKTFACKSMGALKYTDSESQLLPDSIRKIASTTKWFTLIAILRLIEEGKLYLQQPVKDWIEEFKPAPLDKITVFHLLTHTSGIVADGGYFSEPYPIWWGEYEFEYAEYDEDGLASKTAEEVGAIKRKQWMKAILAGPLCCEPGESWNYSSTGFAILGEIIRRVAGVSYEDYIHQIIIKPLGLTRTFFEVPDELLHEVSVVADFEDERLHNREDRTYLPPRAGGGLYSTLSDMNRVGQMLLNGGTLEGKRILSRKSIELMKRDQFPKGIAAYSWGIDYKHYHFGLSSYYSREGDMDYPTSHAHEGAGRCAIMFDDDEQLVLSFFTASAINWVPESVFPVKNIIWSGLR
jgi:CubicO group peptidase (beta-lactamase class C family)